MEYTFAKNKHMKNKFAFFFFFLTTVLFAQKDRLDGVAAVVGNEIILYSDIDQFYFQMREQGLLGKTKCDALGELMFSKLLIHQAKLDSLAVTDEEVSKMARQRLDGLVAQAGSLEEILNFYNKSESELLTKIEDILKDQFYTQRMQQKLVSDVDVTPEEIRSYFASIPKNEIPELEEEIELSHIVKSLIIEKPSKQRVIDQLKQLKKEIEAGASFRTKAIINSEDPGSASNGGEYLGVKRGVFVKEFEAVAFNMQEGEISDPFETESGFHIVQLLKRKGEQLDLRHILITVKPTDEELRKTEQFLDSVVQEIKLKKIIFADAAKLVSDDKYTKYNGGNLVDEKSGDGRFAINKMETDMYLAVNDLEKDSISAPIFSKFNKKDVYIVYKVRDRFKPHRLSFDTDFQRLKRVTENKKKSEVLEKWKKNVIQKTFVKINSDHSSCKALRIWKRKV